MWSDVDWLAVSKEKYMPTGEREEDGYMVKTIAEELDIPQWRVELAIFHEKDTLWCKQGRFDMDEVETAVRKHDYSGYVPAGKIQIRYNLGYRAVTEWMKIHPPLRVQKQTLIRKEDIKPMLKWIAERQDTAKETRRMKSAQRAKMLKAYARQIRIDKLVGGMN